VAGLCVGSAYPFSVRGPKISAAQTPPQLQNLPEEPPRLNNLGQLTSLLWAKASAAHNPAIVSSKEPCDQQEAGRPTWTTVSPRTTYLHPLQNLFVEQSLTSLSFYNKEFVGKGHPAVASRRGEMVEESTIAALEPEQAEVDESEMVEEGVALEVSPPILPEQAEAEREPAEQAEKMEEAPDAQEGEQEEGEKKEGEKVEGDKDGVERQLGEQDGETATAGSDAEENREREAQEVPEHEDAVLAQRDKLTSIMDMEAPDLESASAILDALMSKWDNIDVKQIVDGAKKSLGMVMRRLRKHSNEELSTRANRLFEMYRDE